MNQIDKILNLEGLHHAVIQAREILQVDQPLWFRGVTRSSYKLVPSVWRGSTPRQEESDLTCSFLNRARSRYHACPGNEDYAAWLYLMRHHGLKTRLLDWSESILVAAFFAVHKQVNKTSTASIWAMNPCELNRIQARKKLCLRQVVLRAGRCAGARSGR